MPASSANVAAMSLPPRRRRRVIVPPETGWDLGAAGLPRAFWAVMTVLMLGLAALLLATGYLGYAGMILILAVAAAVNLAPRR